jgi:DNA-binding CsgD family transcriptional regulator
MAARKKEKGNSLSARELLLVKLVCQEKTNAEIAQKLEVSLRVAEKLKTSVYLKTKAKSLIGIFKWAMANGYYTFRGVK